MLGAACREVSLTRIAGVLGWLLAVLYFGVIVAFNVVVVVDLYRPPEGPWPGWWPLIEADALYGGGGLLVVLLVRLAWRRWLSRGAASQPIPT